MTKRSKKTIHSYRHKEKRVNNPEVGMVHADTDIDGEKTQWQYSPHLDPALNFDSNRSGIEKMIDAALASGEVEEMKKTLEELKRLQEPYLNWTGKAEKTNFEVDTVSLHVHERIDPASILANVSKKLRGEAGKGPGQWHQPDLLSVPFENLPLHRAVDFYKHQKGWSNRLICGDSLLVMNSLLAKESMGSKIQMIYIDPPYGIKYGSNFQPFVSNRSVRDRSDEDLTQEPEMIKAFRDTWELGIHSYLTYLRDRLVLAKELLHESGSIFVQISDKNLHHVRELMDEIFGAENFLSQITLLKSTGVIQKSNALHGSIDYIIQYARDSNKVKYRPLFKEKSDVSKASFRWYRNSSGQLIKYSTPGSVRAKFDNLKKQGPGARFDVNFQGRVFNAGQQWWGFSETAMPRLIKAGRIGSSDISLYRIVLETDYPVTALSSLWDDVANIGGMDYVVETPAKVIERCILLSTDPGDLVLDPTCGSGTTAFAAENWGRRWITCDTSRVAITLAKRRLLTASYDYFSLRYPNEGVKSGFNYQTASHVTLKSIANNPDIDGIYDELNPEIEQALDNLNKALQSSQSTTFIPTQGFRKGEQIVFEKDEALYEWEVPPDWPEDWPKVAKNSFNAFHIARQTMQRRMDQSIADFAEQETLYDKPNIDTNRLRISGPFSVEAVPAPTVLSMDDTELFTNIDDSLARSGETMRQSIWRDELLKTGVRAKGGNMMKFAEFETVPSRRFIHLSGSVKETGERVVVSFGPKHAALEQRQVEEAINEAYSLVPKPKYVLFCAFAFDPEAAKDIEELNVSGIIPLKVQMNTDLLTSDLQKNRSSNQSFWLIGQPEIEVRKRTDGRFEVEVYGFDYFNPTSGEVESGNTREIAMWLLDTNYDQRSLMPHQIFFPMAGIKDGWNRLEKTIRAELDEDLLEKFRGTVSIPFELGENKRVAVKIVDNRGIESLKIISLEV